MKISELMKSGNPTISFELFPPKAGMSIEPTAAVVQQIAALRPDFMSVTYGAGGSNSKNTVAVAEAVLKNGVTPLCHMTCVASTKEHIASQLAELNTLGIENILALRGDIPKDSDYPLTGQYRYASELISDIKSSGDFCIGAACYPEGHTECESLDRDIENLRIKVGSGCDFLTTQMFFDNTALYSFLYKALSYNIDIPVIAGIMPVTNGRQIARSCALSGATLPTRFRRIIDRYGNDPESMKQAGIAYATEQIVDLLANGIRGIHVYTMNRPDVAEKIMNNISHLIGR